MKFNFKIITPYGVKFMGDVDRIQVRTTSGEIGVLANHIPLVSETVISILRIYNGDDVYSFAINEGMLYVKDKETILIVKSSENKTDIDFERAKRAKERAEKRLATKDENIDIKRAQLALNRALNRLSLQ